MSTCGPREIGIRNLPVVFSCDGNATTLRDSRNQAALLNCSSELELRSAAENSRSGTYGRILFGREHFGMKPVISREFSGTLRIGVSIYEDGLTEHLEAAAAQLFKYGVAKAVFYVRSNTLTDDQLNRMNESLKKYNAATLVDDALAFSFLAVDKELVIASSFNWIEPRTRPRQKETVDVGVAIRGQKFVNDFIHWK